MVRIHRARADTVLKKRVDGSSCDWSPSNPPAQDTILCSVLTLDCELERSVVPSD